jgi:hypothetical protein
MRRYALRWTCALSSSAAVPAKATGSGVGIFYSVAPDDATPQHFPDSHCWELECSEDSSRLEPTAGRTEVFCLWREGSLCQPVSQFTLPPPQTAASTPARTRGANSIPVAARQNYVRGKVNHVAVEEA